MKLDIENSTGLDRSRLILDSNECLSTQLHSTCMVFVIFFHLDRYGVLGGLKSWVSPFKFHKG